MFSLKHKLLLPLVMTIFFMLMGFTYLLFMQIEHLNHLKTNNINTIKNALRFGLMLLKEHSSKVSQSIAQDWRIADGMIMDNRDQIVDIIVRKWC